VWPRAAWAAPELRRRRTALGWTLEQVAEQARVSVGMLSLIETGKRRPSLRSWERIRQTLGMSEPLPEKAWRQQPRQISDELVATLGACLAAVRQAALAELAQAAGAAISDVRLGLPVSRPFVVGNSRERLRCFTGRWTDGSPQ
jgi:transcriptional regulator with XRE-family HTH domain